MNFGVIMYQTSSSKGQELVAQRMTKELAAQGDKAVLITSRFHDFRPVISAEEVERNGGFVRYDDNDLGLTVYRVQSRSVDWPPRRIEFENFVSSLDRITGELGLDVLVTHSTLWNGPDQTALFVSWKKRIKDGGRAKRILFCHMSHFQPPASTRYSEQEREWRRAWNDYALRRIVREADFLLVTTPSAERHMVELGARREQCLLFPGGIEVPEHRSEGELQEFRRKHGIPPYDRVVTFLGTVEERKNAKAVIRVAELFSERTDLRFVIAGKLDGAYAREIVAEAKKAPNVSVLGEISDEDKSSLIRTSFLNLSMSRLEALGLVQLEFMTAGIPVVTSGVGGQSWVVKNGHTGIVVEGSDDHRGAHAAVLKLLEEDEYRKRLGSNAKRFASRYTMKSLVRDLMMELETKRKPAAARSANVVNRNSIIHWHIHGIDLSRAK